MKTSREKLLAVAFKLFLTKGYAQTSMSDLSRASGLSKGAFHHYFPRKSDILDACIEHFFSDFLPDTEAEGDPGFEDFARQCAEQYGQALCTLISHQIPLAAYQTFLWSMIRDEPEKFQSRHADIVAKLEELIRSQNPYAIRSEDAPRVAREFVAIVEGTGNAVSLNPDISADEIRLAFKTAIDGYLSALKASQS